jgi:hypothetical protein
MPPEPQKQPKPNKPQPNPQPAKHNNPSSPPDTHRERPIHEHVEPTKPWPKK